jgi:hypothetical protein
MVFCGELKNVIHTIIARLVQQKATTHNKIEVLTNVTMLQCKLFF